MKKMQKNAPGKECVKTKGAGGGNEAETIQIFAGKGCVKTKGAGVIA